MTDCRICRMGFGLHLTTCPLSTSAPRVQRETFDRRSYWRPSRPRIPRADYLATVGSSPEQKAELHRARQARYRAARKAKAAA